MTGEETDGAGGRRAGRDPAPSLRFRRRGARASGWGLLVAGLLLPAAAVAKPVVVMPFSGPRAGAATATVRRTLGRHRLVSPSRFIAAAKRSGNSAFRTAGRAAAARALGVSAIVRGTITRLRGRWTLRLSVFSGHNGRAVGSAAFPLRGTRIDASTSRRITTVISRLIARTRAPAGRTVRQVTRVRRPRRARPRRGRRVARRPQRRVALASRSARMPQPLPERTTTRRDSFDDGSDFDRGEATASDRLLDDAKPTISPARRVANAASRNDDLGFEVGRRDNNDDSDIIGVDDDDDSRVASYDRVRKSADDDADEEDDDGGETRTTTKRPTKRPPWESVIEASAGVMLVNRTFNFNEPVEPADPADYQTPAVVPALYIEGAAYPLAALTRSALANFGVTAKYFRVLALESKLPGKSTAADTVVQQFEFGLAYRWNILSKLSSPTLRLGVDYGRLMFFILDEGNIDLPNISYAYINLGAGLDVPIYARPRFTFGAAADFSYMAVLSAGEIQNTDSAGYGSGTTGGVNVGLGLFARFGGFFVRATGFYRRIFFSFDGVCYQQRTGCNYAGGALDIYMGGKLHVGYAY